MATNATELTLQPRGESIAPVIDYNREQIELIKDVYAKGATDAELRLFIEIARRKGLDIFSNQIYLVERYDSALGKNIKRPQTSIDGFRLIADRTGEYAPGRKAEFTHDEDGAVITATAFVQKRVQGDWFEVSSEVWFDEYKQTKKDGSMFPIWRKMPHVMLSKCAEAVTLRKAFPADLSGLYTSDEMGSAEPEPAPQAEPRNVTPTIGQHSPVPAKAIAAPGAKTPMGVLTELIKEIRGFGISDAELKAYMKSLTGKEKRADLSVDEAMICVEGFETWALELQDKQTETTEGNTDDK